MAILDEETDDGVPVARGGEAVDLGPLPSFPGYLFRQGQIKVFTGLHAILAPDGIRTPVFGVMILLKYNPGIRPSEVAAALGLKRANFVPLLDELRNRGLAKAEARSDDRRSRAITLTDAGREMIERLEAAAREYERGINAKIDPENAGLLAAMVARL